MKDSTSEPGKRPAPKRPRSQCEVLGKCVFRPTELDAFASIDAGYPVLDASMGRSTGEAVPPTPDMTRVLYLRCTVCKRLKRAYDHFPPDPRRRDGFDTRCLECRRLQMRAHRRRKITLDLKCT